MKRTKYFFRKAKYFSIGVANRQYPKKSINTLMSKFTWNLEAQTQGFESQNYIFTTWKVEKLHLSHWKAWRDFVQSNSPTYSFVFFDQKMMDDWMQKRSPKDIYEIYERSVFGASKVDLFRLVLLQRYGGAFFSINRVLTQPISSIWLEKGNFVVSFENNHYERIHGARERAIPGYDPGKSLVQYALMGPKGHNFFGVALDYIVSIAPQFEGKVFPLAKEAIWKFTAPYMLTEALEIYLDKYGDSKLSWAGLNYHEAAKIPEGAIYRYATSPSYLGEKNVTILKQRKLRNSK